MKSFLCMGLFLFAAISVPIKGVPALNLQYSQAVASEEMVQVQLIIKKLTGSLASLKDLDALEEAGLPKQDVLRMKAAMKMKIGQLTDTVIKSIHAL